MDRLTRDSVVERLERWLESVSLDEHEGLGEEGVTYLYAIQQLHRAAAPVAPRLWSGPRQIGRGRWLSGDLILSAMTWGHAR
jgi:hypothetical protein